MLYFVRSFSGLTVIPVSLKMCIATFADVVSLPSRVTNNPSSSFLRLCLSGATERLVILPFPIMASLLTFLLISFLERFFVFQCLYFASISEFCCLPECGIFLGTSACVL